VRVGRLESVIDGPGDAGLGLAGRGGGFLFGGRLRRLRTLEEPAKQKQHDRGGDDEHGGELR